MAAEQEGSLEEGKAVPHSPGGSSLEGEGNHTHPAVHMCMCVCVCVCDFIDVSSIQHLRKFSREKTGELVKSRILQRKHSYNHYGTYYRLGLLSAPLL